MAAIAILFLLAFLWTCGPLGMCLYFALRYGCGTQCVQTWWIGPGAPIGIEFSAAEFYWCPFGIVGLQVEMEV